jgi:hypothetical protein
LEQCLAKPANAQGVTLAAVIRRLRNQVLVHHSFDLEEQGPALIYLGLPDELAATAFEGLLASVSRTLAEILSSSTSDITQTPERARQAERQRRQRQSSASKKADIDKPTSP